MFASSVNWTAESMIAQRHIRDVALVDLMDTAEMQSHLAPTEHVCHGGRARQYPLSVFNHLDDTSDTAHQYRLQPNRMETTYPCWIMCNQVAYARFNTLVLEAR